MKKFRYVILNSSLLFVIATILEMTLHESGHFTAAYLLHAKNLTLHHNYVSYGDNDLTTLYRIIIASTGPIVSLGIGMLFHFICSRQQKRNLLFFFNLYMAIFGYIGFFGYLCIAPMFAGGDTGYVLRAIHLPMWSIIIIAVIGGIILYWLIKQLTKYFVEMGSKELVENMDNRKPFIHALIQYPLYIGIIITSLLNLPIPVWLSIIAPVCSPFTIMWTYGDALTKPFPSENTNKEFEKFNSLRPLLFIFLLIIIVVNRFLVYGIHVN